MPVYDGTKEVPVSTLARVRGVTPQTIYNFLKGRDMQLELFQKLWEQHENDIGMRGENRIGRRQYRKDLKAFLEEEKRLSKNPSTEE